MALVLRSLANFASAPHGSAGATVNFYVYASNDAAATVLAGGYFNEARNKLKVNDVIFIMAVAGGVGDLLIVKVTAAPSTGNVTVAVETEAAGT